MPGTVVLDEETLVAPDDEAEIGLTLLKPVGLEKGIRFAIREGGKTTARAW